MSFQDGPIFVVGSMRSGSTMLRLILDSHPHIAIPPETGFMGGLRAAKQIPHWKFGKGWYERLGWAEEEVDERLREFYSGMFARYAASKGKQRWGEKTPFHTEHITEMAQVFPDAKVYGAATRPELRVITCGGGYSRTTGYQGNVVVYAHLTGSR